MACDGEREISEAGHSLKRMTSLYEENRNRQRERLNSCPKIAHLVMLISIFLSMIFKHLCLRPLFLIFISRIKYYLHSFYESNAARLIILQPSGNEDFVKTGTNLYIS
ncbi:hypothetical protein CDAR_459561 [Caerostris darwini]|uniref:Uncharacterized protein n=1 Tax=Caerostris darwini TaxID=1538125 RepID=A0AAV4UTN6_9ARAC|nr:hypothetical protein CDAR_459561 [Caerostris darwini]